MRKESSMRGGSRAFRSHLHKKNTAALFRAIPPFSRSLATNNHLPWFGDRPDHYPHRCLAHYWLFPLGGDP